MRTQLRRAPGVAESVPARAALRLRSWRGWLALGVCAGAALVLSQRAAPPTSAGRPPTEAEPQPAATDGSEELHDVDRDGVEDAREDWLAEANAPIVFHGERETTFPTNVDSWLLRTHLDVVGGPSGGVRRVQTGPLRQSQLVGHSVSTSAGLISSSGSRSRRKIVSFVLENVARPAAEAVHPDDWVTYVHSYPNDSGGITLQYWRAYVRNDASFLGLDLGHGGDWEAVAVHLDAEQQARKVTYLDHSGIVDVTRLLQWEGRHPLVWSGEGGHASYPDNRRSQSTRWLRQETWTGGVVTRWDGVSLGRSGGLRNVGEKLHPRNGQIFIQYSGLWGAPARLSMTSGYWGPAFNETGALCHDGAPAYGSYLRPRARSAQCVPLLMKAWCDGMTRLSARTLECHALTEPF